MPKTQSDYTLKLLSSRVDIPKGTEYQMLKEGDEVSTVRITRPDGAFQCLIPNHVLGVRKLEK